VSPRRQRRLAESIPGARTYEVEGDHAVCVMGAARFVPVLLDAARDVSHAAALT
jgi:3-oxoadipate enol-lactonase